MDDADQRLARRQRARRPPRRRAFSLIAAMKSLTTGSATSASSSARRTSRSASWMLSSVSRASPRSPLTTCDRRCGQIVEHGSRSGRGLARSIGYDSARARPAMARAVAPESDDFTVRRRRGPVRRSPRALWPVTAGRAASSRCTASVRRRGADRPAARSLLHAIIVVRAVATPQGLDLSFAQRAVAGGGLDGARRRGCRGCSRKLPAVGTVVLPVAARVRARSACARRQRRIASPMPASPGRGAHRRRARRLRAVRGRRAAGARADRARKAAAPRRSRGRKRRRRRRCSRSSASCSGCRRRLRAADADARERDRCSPSSSSASRSTFTHKNVFSVLGWLTFGALLFGRWRYGWRGRVGAVLDPRRDRASLARLPRQQVRARGPARALSGSRRLIGRLPAQHARRRARGAARHVRILLDRRDGDDGGQPLSPEAPRAARQRAARSSRWRCSHRPTRLLGVILLGNNLINAGAATLAGVMTARLLGEGKLALAREHGRRHVPDPRVLRDHAEGGRRGARRPHRAARRATCSRRCCSGLRPSSGSSTCSCRGCSSCCGSGRAPDAGAQLTQEELRSLVLEGSQYFRGKHRRCSPTCWISRPSPSTT